MKRGHFLNAEQKQIKQKIMEGLMESLFGTLEKNIDKFDSQSMADAIFSCLVMFSRDVMVRLILGTEDLSNTSSMISQFEIALSNSIAHYIQEYSVIHGESH